MGNPKSNSNQFRILASFDSNMEDSSFLFDERARVARSRNLRTHMGKTPEMIFKEVTSFRNEILCLSDLSGKEKIVVRSIAKAIEEEVTSLRKEQVFDSKRLAALEERNSYLKRASPERMKPLGKEDRKGNVFVANKFLTSNEDSKGSIMVERPSMTVTSTVNEVICSGTSTISGDNCCVIDTPVSAKKIIQSGHMEGNSNIAHQVFEEMSQPVYTGKIVDMRDTVGSEEEESSEEVLDDTSSVGINPIAEAFAHKEPDDQPHPNSETNIKVAGKEQLLARPNKTWVNVVEDSLPRESFGMLRLSSLSSKIELVDLGLPSDPNVLEIEDVRNCQDELVLMCRTLCFRLHSGTLFPLKDFGGPWSCCNSFDYGDKGM
ncbi:hypothetical protein U1Q18_017910 [Sarracenia purpurea var. burkii]